MKQESINSFNGGLNTDLNPLTTPNNILTDCLNGTFLTFNGDELSLQNDAGNTTIDYNGSPVSLSPGFYPIGIKEYGGVLYIVSGQKPTDTSVLWAENTSYLLDQIVRYGLNGEIIYYKSKVPSNNYTLPVESDSYWLVIGTLEDYNNYYGKVEIGSYPSPEFAGSTSFVGNTLSYIESNIPPETNISNILYKSIVINEEYFKSGRYITFGNTSLVLNYVSSYLSDFTYSPKFYKVKLWHQLNNGYLDLTDDIWQKYCDYKGSNIVDNHWFNDALFKYYCPNQFKGKLAMSVEIEDLEKFSLYGIPTLIPTSSTEYKMEVSVEVIGKGSIVPIGINYIIFKDNTSVYIGTSTIVNNIATFAYLFDDSYTEAVISYEISPILQVNSIDITSELPTEYINKYTIKGSRFVNPNLEIADYTIITANSVCEGNAQPYKIHNQVLITDKNGNWIDNSLILSTTPYVFLRQGETAINIDGIEPIVIANYTILNNYPVINFETILTNTDSSLYLFQNSVQVRVDDENCAVIELPIYISPPVKDVSQVTLTQSGQDVTPTYASPSEFKFYIFPNQDFTLSISGQESSQQKYEDIIYNGNISNSAPLNFGRILNITKVYTGTWVAQWTYMEDSPGIGDFPIRIATTEGTSNAILSYEPISGWYISSPPIEDLGDTPTIYTFGTINPTSGDYANIDNSESFWVVNDRIIRKAY